MRSFAGIDRNKRVTVRTRGKLLKVPGITALIYQAQIFNGTSLVKLRNVTVHYGFAAVGAGGMNRSFTQRFDPVGKYLKHSGASVHS